MKLAAGARATAAQAVRATVSMRNLVAPSVSVGEPQGSGVGGVKTVVSSGPLGVGTSGALHAANSSTYRPVVTNPVIVPESSGECGCLGMGFFALRREPTIGIVSANYSHIPYDDARPGSSRLQILR